MINYLIQDLLFVCYAAIALWAVRWAVRKVYAAGRRRAHRKAQEANHMALVMRLAWMAIDATPSKVFYVTRDQLNATPDAAYLKLQLTKNGYALKTADAPDPSTEINRITVGN